LVADDAIPDTFLEFSAPQVDCCNNQFDGKALKARNERI